MHTYNTVVDWFCLIDQVKCATRLYDMAAMQFAE